MEDQSKTQEVSPVAVQPTVRDLPALILTLAIDRNTGRISLSDNVQPETGYEDIQKLSEALAVLGERLKQQLLTLAREAGKREAEEAKQVKERKATVEREAKTERRRKSTQAKKSSAPTKQEG